MIKCLNKILIIFVILMLVSMGMQFAVAKGVKNPVSEKSENKGIKRHPDSIHDSNGVLHKLWQEPFEGQFEIMYAFQGESKEMGLGTDSNPAVRITNTPADSVRPQIAIDPSTDIVYIFWTENLPTTLMSPAYNQMFEPSIFYTATDFSMDANNEQTWTEPQNLADGGSNVVDVKVESSRFEILMPGSSSKALEGVLDSDGDGISDSDEFFGALGFETEWDEPDTDFDGLEDLVEIELKFDPLIDERTTSRAQEFLRATFLHSDFDEDGLTYTEETTGSFPVTVGVVLVLNGGNIIYEFYPKSDYDAYVNLEMQIRRAPLPPSPEYAGFTISGTVYSTSYGLQRFTYSDSALEQEYITVSIGPFDVPRDVSTKVNLYLDVDSPGPMDDMVVDPDTPSSSGLRFITIYSIMLAAAAPDYNSFDYKEGRDCLSYPFTLAARSIENIEISPDPNRPDIFLELDYLEDHDMPPELMSEAINAFSDAGIILHYKSDEYNIPLDAPTTPDAGGDGALILNEETEVRDFSHRHRNSAYTEYIHVIFAHKIFMYGVWIYGVAKSSATAGDLTHAGVIIADQEIIEVTNMFSTLAERRLAVLLHELGHTLGAAHEGLYGLYNALVDGPGGDDTVNPYNIMRSGHLASSQANYMLRGSGNTDRIMGATYLIREPRFCIETIDQFNLKNKLSVDTGRNYDLLSNYV